MVSLYGKLPHHFMLKFQIGASPYKKCGLGSLTVKQPTITIAIPKFEPQIQILLQHITHIVYYVYKLRANLHLTNK